MRQTRTGPVNIATYFAHNLTIINYRRTGEVSPYDPFIYIFIYRQDSASVYQPDVAASRGVGSAWLGCISGTANWLTGFR
ncbi:MAG: hypothetical protein U0528_09995 [Anaerolineae bacterium]